MIKIVIEHFKVIIIREGYLSVPTIMLIKERLHRIGGLTILRHVPFVERYTQDLKLQLASNVEKWDRSQFY